MNLNLNLNKSMSSISSSEHKPKPETKYKPQSNQSNTITKISYFEEDLVKKLDYLENINMKNIKQHINKTLFFVEPQQKQSTKQKLNTNLYKFKLENSNKPSNYIEDKSLSIIYENKVSSEIKYIKESLDEFYTKKKRFSSELKAIRLKIDEVKIEIDLIQKNHPSIKHKDDVFYFYCYYVENFMKKERITSNILSLIKRIHMKRLCDRKERKNKRLDHDDYSCSKLIKRNSGLNYSSMNTITSTNDNNTHCSLTHNTINNDNDLNGSITLNKDQLTCASQTKLKLEQTRLNEEKALNERLFSLIKDKNIIYNKIESIESEIFIYKKVEKDMIDLLILHYHKILSIGNDYRAKGLIWIIKEIFLYDREVIISYMPRFLDDKSIEFLLTLAKYSIEEERVENIISELKEELKILNKDYYEIEKICRRIIVKEDLEGKNKERQENQSNFLSKLKLNSSNTRNKSTNIINPIRNQKREKTYYESTILNKKSKKGRYYDMIKKLRRLGDDSDKNDSTSSIKKINIYRNQFSDSASNSPTRLIDDNHDNHEKNKEVLDFKKIFSFNIIKPHSKEDIHNNKNNNNNNTIDKNTNQKEEKEKKNLNLIKRIKSNINKNNQTINLNSYSNIKNFLKSNSNSKTISTSQYNTINTQSLHNPLQYWEKTQLKLEEIINKKIEKSTKSKLKQTEKDMLFVEKVIRTGIKETEMNMLSFKSINKYLDNKKKINPESIELINTIHNKEKELNKVKSKINQIKSVEMRRISKEIITNDYLRRFDVSINCLFGALVGEEHMNEEIQKYEKERRYYVEGIKQSRIFTIAEGLNIHGSI